MLEVYYVGPVLNTATSLMCLQESSDDGKTATAERREMMGVRLKTHRLTKTRHALAMKDPGGGASRPRSWSRLTTSLSGVTRACGVGGSRPRTCVCSRLRQHNFRQQRNPAKVGGKKLAQKMRSVASCPEVPDLEVSPEEQLVFFRGMRTEMSNEKTMLDLMTGEALPVEAQEEVWEAPC